MEVEIEKVVKAQKEAQSAAEVADRKEQIAHNTESRTTSSRRRTRRNTSRKWKLNSRRSVMASSLSWTKTSSHRSEGLQESKAINKGRQEVIQFEQVDFEQVAEKRQTASQAKNAQHNHKRSRLICPRTHSTTRKVVAVEGQQKPSRGLNRESSRRETSCRDNEQGSDVEEFT